MTLLNRLGLAALVLPFLGAAPSPALAQDTQAEWLKRPAARDLMAVWPRAAMKSGKGGKALIGCVVTVQGAVRDCQIISESPAGAGFGGAGLVLSAQFLLKPATHNGTPVEGYARIPIEFPDLPAPTGSYLPESAIGGGKPIRVISGVPWLQAPSFSDVLATYPAKAREAKVSGRVALDCIFDKSGAIGRCVTLQEEPGFSGFAGAARRLAPRFLGPLVDGKGQSLAGAHVQIPFTFAAESLSVGTPIIGKPQWTALPSSADLMAAYPKEALKAGVLKARVVLSCTVTERGAVSDCKVDSEDPPGHGIGAATVGLTAPIRLSIWSPEGLPTVGGSVRLPIRYEFAAKPQPPKP